MKNITIKNRVSTLKCSFVFLLALSIGGCGNNAPTKGAQEEVANPLNVSLSREQYQTAGIAIGKMEKKNMSNVLHVTGIVDLPPQNRSSVSAVMGGFVRQMDLLQGMKVQQGQVLAVLEHPDYIQLQQDYQEALARLDFLQLEYNRQEELTRENATAGKTFQQVTSDLKTLQARVNGMQTKLQMVGLSPANAKAGNYAKRVNLLAPISGYITQINVNVGKFVNPNDILIEIADTRHLHAEMYVYEKDIYKIQMGQMIELFPVNRENKSYMAEVYLIGKEIATDKTVRVHCHFEENQEIDLLTGTSLKGIIELDENNVPVLPESAVVSLEGKDYVFVEQATPTENKEQHYLFKMIEVKVDKKENGFISFAPTDAIPVDSDKIVLKGAYDLLGQLKNKGEEE